MVQALALVAALFGSDAAGAAPMRACLDQIGEAVKAATTQGQCAGVDGNPVVALFDEDLHAFMAGEGSALGLLLQREDKAGRLGAFLRQVEASRAAWRAGRPVQPAPGYDAK